MTSQGGTSQGGTSRSERFIEKMKQYGFEYGDVIREQIDAMGDDDLRKLEQVVRAISDGAGELLVPEDGESFERQSLLEGAYAITFEKGTPWRVLYDRLDPVRLHGIVDYHSGERHVPLYLLDRAIDLG